MCIFNIFKKRNKLYADMNKSIDEYFYKVKKYKTLKASELNSVFDSDLRTAVMSWMWGKFNEDWTDQYDVIRTLPKPCQNVYACCTVVDEINNGGLNQLFYNSTGQFAKMAQEGFHDIGNEKLSGIMRDAIEIYEKNKELLDKYDDGTLESFMQSYIENLFNDLDDGYSEEEPEFEKLLLEYIRKNESYFGD